MHYHITSVLNRLYTIKNEFPPFIRYANHAPLPNRKAFLSDAPRRTGSRRTGSRQVNNTVNSPWLPAAETAFSDFA